MRNRFNLIGEAALQGAVEVQMTAYGAGERIARVRRLPLVAMLTVLSAALVGGAPVIAAACGNGAADTLKTFINQAATFLMFIGGASGLLMFAVGGFLIIVGGTPDRVSKGMKIIKNTVIGLAVLGSGVFISKIVTSFVQGAAKGASTNCIDQGSKGLAG